MVARKTTVPVAVSMSAVNKGRFIAHHAIHRYGGGEKMRRKLGRESEHPLSVRGSERKAIRFDQAVPVMALRVTLALHGPHFSVHGPQLVESGMAPKLNDSCLGFGSE